MYILKQILNDFTLLAVGTLFRKQLYVDLYTPLEEI